MIRCKVIYHCQKKLWYFIVNMPFFTCAATVTFSGLVGYRLVAKNSFMGALPVFWNGLQGQGKQGAKNRAGVARRREKSLCCFL